MSWVNAPIHCLVDVKAAHNKENHDKISRLPWPKCGRTWPGVSLVLVPAEGRVVVLLGSDEPPVAIM